MSLKFTPITATQSREVAESEHVVDCAVWSPNGLEMAFGDVSRPVIPRSSIKPIQVIPLVATGAAEAFGFSDEDVALATASHSAEVAHSERVQAMLKRSGLEVRALECGATRPISEVEGDRLVRAGESFGRIHNCCSGKHAGFLAVAQHLGVDPAGYIEPDHEVQRLVTGAIERFSGFDLTGQSPGIDGCGIPTYAIPLDHLAASMTALVAPDAAARLSEADVYAANRVSRALQAHPYWMSGTDRCEVILADRSSEPLISKVGAEGVYMAALPARGFGIALKARDGARRAADTAMEAVLNALGVLSPGRPVHTVTNSAGTVVGTMNVSWL